MAKIPPTSTEKRKIKEKLKKIQDTMDKQGRFGYYLLVDDQVKLIAKGNDEDEIEREVLAKINKKQHTVGCFIYLVEIHIIQRLVDKPVKYVAGPVQLGIKQFIISPKFKLIHKGTYHDGSLWYTNDDILNGGFHFTDIKTLIGKVDDENIFIDSMAGKRALKVLNND